MSHVIPFSKIKQRHFVGHLRYFYLCLQGPWGNGSRERIWKEDLYLMTLRLSFKPCIFSPSLFLFNKTSREKVSKGGGRERETGRRVDLNIFQYLKTQNNYLLRSSEPGLETDFSNYKIKKVTQVFMHL